MVNCNENKDENEKGLEMGANVVNIRIVSLRWWLYLLSSTLATFEAIFDSSKKLSNTKAEFK